MKPNIDIVVDYLRDCIQWIGDIRELYEDPIIGSQEFADIIDIKIDNIETYIGQAIYELTNAPQIEQDRENVRLLNEDHDTD